jgi:hypothetical protein
MTKDLNELSRFLKYSLIFSKDPNQEHILKMNADEISGVLSTIHSFLNKFFDYTKNHEYMSIENKISENERLFLELFFSELYQNFFPMAHTLAPLKNLKIVCASVPDNQYEDLKKAFRMIENASKELELSSSVYADSVKNLNRILADSRDRMNIEKDGS